LGDKEPEIDFDNLFKRLKAAYRQPDARLKRKPAGKHLVTVIYSTVRTLVTRREPIRWTSARSTIKSR